MVFNWKNYSESFKRSFLIILAYGLAFGLGYIFRFGHVAVNFYVSEQEKFATYQIGLKDFVDLLFIGPIFTIISFFLLKRILDDFTEQDLSKNKNMAFFLIYLIAIVIFNYGNIIHVTMNRLNAQIIEEYSTEDVYYSVYFLDEFMGHTLLTIGLFIVITEICFLHTLNLQNRSNLDNYSENLMNKYEEIWNFIFGMGLGVVTAFTYLEGQCAFLYLILNPIFCVLLIFYSRKCKINVKENSLLIIFIIMTIMFAFTVIIWGLITGFKPVYPFFYQYSEL